MNRLMNWLWGHCGSSHVLRVLATAAILFGAPPAWTQNEGVGAPNPENTFHSSTVASYFSRFARPQTAQAAPRNIQRQTQRVRMSRAKKPLEKPVEASAPQPPAEADAAPPVSPAFADTQEPSWPNAQENVGAAGLVPVVIKTVREIIEAESETPVVREHELSDLDLAARPVASRDELPVAATDGRADADEEWRGNRFAAFAENVKAIGSASWLEPVLLVLAGAFAAAAAMRVFAA
jgi:hypothetical protein